MYNFSYTSPCTTDDLHLSNISLSDLLLFHDTEFKTILVGSAFYRSYDLGGGVVCDECFAYLGSSLLIIVAYKYGGFSFEIKGGGDLGIKAAINVLNPSVYGSNSYYLMNPETSYSGGYLGGYFYLGYKFGGLTATVSGSGSATGSASFSTSQSVRGSLGLMVVSPPLAISVPNAFYGQYSSPVLSSSSFSADSFSLTVDLTGTEDFYISYIGYIKFYFSSSLSGSVTVAMSMMTSAYVSIMSVPKSSSSFQLDSTPRFKSYVPGEIITIKFDYSGFNPSENTTVFYSIEKSNSSHPIMQRYFITSLTGSGTFIADWVVPWDYSLDRKSVV